MSFERKHCVLCSEWSLCIQMMPNTRTLVKTQRHFFLLVFSSLHMVYFSGKRVCVFAQGFMLFLVITIIIIIIISAATTTTTTIIIIFYYFNYKYCVNLCLCMTYLVVLLCKYILYIMFTSTYVMCVLIYSLTEKTSRENVKINGY